MRRNVSGNLGLYKYIWSGSVYMFICSELIEETGRPLGLNLASRDIFGLARTSSSFGKVFTHLTEL